MTDRVADTPQPPYWAVIFSNVQAEAVDGYGAMAEAMERLAAVQPGYLGFESARSGLGISISYWSDLDAIAAWKRQVDHLAAQRMGRERWYAAYRVRVARVERDYGFQR